MLYLVFYMLGNIGHSIFRSNTGINNSYGSRRGFWSGGGLFQYTWYTYLNNSVNSYIFDYYFLSQNGILFIGK